MAEMGWEADLRVRPRSADLVHPMTRTRRFGIAIAVVLVAAMVTGLLFIDRDVPKPGPQVQLDVSVTVPATTATPSTTTESTAAAAPSVTAELPPAMPIAKPLAADTTYRLGQRSARQEHPVHQSR